MSTTVLVVEDETIIRMNMVLHLEDEGFVVFEAASADEAITMLNAHQEVRVLFTDIDMPGSMDGLKLSAYVRERWPPVRIIVTSGKRMVEVTDLPDGSMFFSKPYQLDNVVVAIRELVSNSSNAATSVSSSLS
ncbi:MAG: response regulator [Devosia sp.]